MYVAMERKRDNGCEIQNSACGTSGIMMRLKLVKTADENRNVAADHPQQLQLVEGQAVPHATAILRELILPWTLCRFIICLNSGSKALEPAWFAIYRCGQNFHSKLSNELSAVS